ncbi:hypothetical protein BDN72DRAFT_845263 [Pluteus cervinus]|uniref:Uncharacterized protein n=1 Tax=Pluteus cervinus TaxID=181527 RepID=A0ACD3AJ35_9AGAR|nr:hypothetical protein BDN72DRAFT_845263 [Pluteus cervinus]
MAGSPNIEAHPPPVDTGKRHPIYWFEDGTLVLRVEDVLFNIHRGFLNGLSSYLKSACEQLPKGKADHLDLDPSRGIASRDVETLLQVIYHDLSLSPQTPFHQLASVLRASSPEQFDIPLFFTQATQSLYKTIPSGPVPNYRHDNLEEALILATEYQLDGIRATLLYAVMIADDVRIEQSSEASPNGAIAPPSKLPTHIEELTTKLMTKTIDLFSPTLFTAPATPHMACTSTFAEHWLRLVIEPGIADQGVYKPLESLERFKNIDWASHGLCPSCVKEKGEEWTEEQNSYWRLLDAWIDG